MERITEKNKPKRKKLAGFSVLEMLVAMFIFAMIITVTISAFIASFKGQKKTKDVQQSMEDARGAIELMAKNIRMGTIDSGDATSIYFYNYSQEKCIMYTQVGDKIRTGEVSGSRVDNSDCTGIAVTSDLIADPVVDNLNFVITKSDYNAPTPVVGKVTISIKVKNSTEPIQTTISLRDYNE